MARDAYTMTWKFYWSSNLSDKVLQQKNLFQNFFVEVKRLNFNLSWNQIKLPVTFNIIISKRIIINFSFLMLRHFPIPIFLDNVRLYSDRQETSCCLFDLPNAIKATWRNDGYWEFRSCACQLPRMPPLHQNVHTPCTRRNGVMSRRQFEIIEINNCSGLKTGVDWNFFKIREDSYWETWR
jgi:hypothetical protein